MIYSSDANLFGLTHNYFGNIHVCLEPRIVEYDYKSRYSRGSNCPSNSLEYTVHEEGYTTERVIEEHAEFSLCFCYVEDFLSDIIISGDYEMAFTYLDEFLIPRREELNIYNSRSAVCDADIFDSYEKVAFNDKYYKLLATKDHPAFNIKKGDLSGLINKNCNFFASWVDADSAFLSEGIITDSYLKNSIVYCSDSIQKCRIENSQVLGRGTAYKSYIRMSLSLSKYVCADGDIEKDFLWENSLAEYTDGMCIQGEVTNISFNGSHIQGIITYSKESLARGKKAFLEWITEGSKDVILFLSMYKDVNKMEISDNSFYYDDFRTPKYVYKEKGTFNLVHEIILHDSFGDVKFEFKDKNIADYIYYSREVF